MTNTNNMICKENWEIRVDRFDDPMSPYYNADLEDNDFDDNSQSSRFEYIAKKQVTDANGITTNYTLWYDNEEQKYIGIFGGSDLYEPADGIYDFDTKSEEKAYEWFTNYTGFAD